MGAYVYTRAMIIVTVATTIGYILILSGVGGLIFGTPFTIMMISQGSLYKKMFLVELRFFKHTI